MDNRVLEPISMYGKVWGHRAQEHADASLLALGFTTTTWQHLLLRKWVQEMGFPPREAVEGC